jgi:hypothetical protein
LVNHHGFIKSLCKLTNVFLLKNYTVVCNNEGMSKTLLVASMMNNIMWGHSVVGVGQELAMEMFGVRVGDVDDG